MSCGGINFIKLLVLINVINDQHRSDRIWVVAAFFVPCSSTRTLQLRGSAQSRLLRSAGRSAAAGAVLGGSGLDFIESPCIPVGAALVCISNGNDSSVELRR